MATESPQAGLHVDLSRDGPNLTPAESAELLSRIAAGGDIEPDRFSIGGTVAELEQFAARELGKEAALFVPTGTLANHLAVRALARGDTRVVVQAESHLARDSGDGAALLAGLRLIPLAPGRPTFSMEELDAACGQTEGEKVPTRVGVVSIETPVRRLASRRFDADELERVVRRARAHGARVHLDGARIHVLAAWSGCSLADLAAPFDTVYLSLYKCFGAPSGALLAGPFALIAELVHLRRTYGGSPWESWPTAALALHHAHGVLPGLELAAREFEHLIDALQSGLIGESEVSLRVFDDGTNVVALHVPSGLARPLHVGLAAHGIRLPEPDAEGTFWLHANASIGRAGGACVGTAIALALRGLGPV